MTIEKRATAGSFVGVVGLALNIAQSLVLVPLLLSFWTASTYGLWMGVGAVTALLISFDTGHKAYLGNVINLQWVECRKNLPITVRSGILFGVVIASVELLVGLSLLVSGRLSLFSGSLEIPVAGVAGAIMLNLLYAGLSSSVGGILVRMYVPAGLFAWGQWYGVFYRLSGFLAVIAAVAMMGTSIFGAMLAQVSAWAACDLFIFLDLRRRFPEIYPWWRGGDWKLAWKNFRTSLVLTVNGFIEQAGNNGLVLFIGHILNPIAVALFTTLRTVSNLALQGSSILLNPLTPDLVRYHVKKEGDKLTAVFCVSWVLGTTAVAGGLVIGVFVLEPLYAIWTRGALPLNKLLFALLGTAVAVRQWAAPLQTYLTSLNRLRVQSAMAVTRAACGLGLAALLLKPVGLAAAGLGALAAEVGAATVAVIAVRAELRPFAAGVPLAPAVLSLGQIAIAFVVWLLFAETALGLAGAGAIALLLILAFGCLQWIALPQAVRVRLTLGLRRDKDACAADA